MSFSDYDKKEKILVSFDNKCLEFIGEHFIKDTYLFIGMPGLKRIIIPLLKIDIIEVTDI